MDEEMMSNTSMAEPEPSVQAASAAAEASSSSTAAAKSQSQSLSPASYTNWIRSAQRKLLSAAAKGDQPSDALFTGLEEALQAKRNALSLSAREWKLWLAATIWRSSSSSASPGVISDVEEVRAILELHQDATRASNASALDLSAFVTYVNLILSLHYAFEEVQSRPPTFWQDDDEAQWIAESEQDMLKEWTGLANGPKLLSLRHKTTRYALCVGYPPSTLPSIPTRSQAKAAGVEAQWASLLGEANTRALIREANSRAAGELNWSHLVWDAYRDFELVHLAKAKTPDRIEAVKQVYLARLRVPHRTHEATAQAFSSFLSSHMPPDAYESTMSSLQKAYGAAKATWSSVEIYEDQVRSFSPALGPAADDDASWQAWSTYLRAASSRRNADVDLVSALYERCVAFLGPAGALPSLEEEQHAPEPQWEATLKATRQKTNKTERQAQEQAEKQALRQRRTRREDLWYLYLAFLMRVSKSASATHALDVCDRATRSLPGSGLLWATYLRQLAHHQRSKAHIDEIFTRAFEGGQCAAEDKERQHDASSSSSQPAPSSVIEILIGRIDAERHLAALDLATQQGLDFSDALAQLPKDANAFTEIYALIDWALQLPTSRPAASTDKSLRLQRLASSWSEAGGEGMSSLADAIWETALQQQPSNADVWLYAAQYNERQGNVSKARSLYRQGTGRNKISDTTMLLEAWGRFEGTYGSTEDVMRAEERGRRLREKQWEEWAAYAQMQQEQYAAYARASAGAGAGGGMEVDGEAADESVTSGGKRKASASGGAAAASTSMAIDSAPANGVTSPTAESSKKGKQGDSSQPARDRENSSILVSNLPQDATMADLQRLFNDCGPIREISEPRAIGASNDEAGTTAAATVEFMDRSSIPAARTKDKKRLRGQEIAVHLGWECTLYVTNFPSDPSWDDARIRSLFSAYGSVYDVRWPSKRFASTRRFCYVQYTSPHSAREAQGALHQHTLEGGLALQVHLSDPHRRKQRTDAHLNEREVYATNIPRTCSYQEVMDLFQSLGGTVEGLRLPESSSSNRLKGVAFVDYRTELEARQAVSELDGRLLRGKAIRVVLAGREHQSQTGGAGGGGAAHASGSGSGSGTSSGAGFTSRAVRVLNLPSDATEPLIQQLFERLAGGVGSVRKVEWTPGASSSSSPSAIIELQDPATAGKVVLLGESGGAVYVHPTDPARRQHVLGVLPLERGAAVAAAAAMKSPSPGPSSAAGVGAAPTAFVPRRAAGGGRGGRGRGGGLGFAGARPAQVAAATASGGGGGAMDVDEGASGGGNASASGSGGGGASKKNQDAFRAMLAGGGGGGGAGTKQ